MKTREIYSDRCKVAETLMKKTFENNLINENERKNKEIIFTNLHFGLNALIYINTSKNHLNEKRLVDESVCLLIRIFILFKFNLYVLQV